MFTIGKSLSLLFYFQRIHSLIISLVRVHGKSPLVFNTKSLVFLVIWI